jgi:polysaccharide pyruvyl transferase WcaK-like protein
MGGIAEKLNLEKPSPVESGLIRRLTDVIARRRAAGGRNDLVRADGAAGILMQGSPVRVCLLGAALNTGNLGISALVSGTVASVLSTFPNAQIFLLEYGREPAKYEVHWHNGPVEVELVNIRFSKKIFLRNNIARLLAGAFFIGLLPASRWKDSLYRKNICFRKILEADVVASIAGGDSFSDIYGLPRLWYMALPQILALWLGKPLILLPQTLGPFKGIGARAIARYIMRRAVVVYSRDRAGVQEAGPLLGAQKNKLKFSPDMAFVLEPLKPEASKLAGLPLQNPAPLIGLNISGLLLMGGYTRNNMFGLKADYARLVREMISYFVREHQANILLVPHVVGDDLESDTSACESVFKELNPGCQERLFLLPDNFNQHEIKYVIGQCDFFIGSRMHACIAALSQSIPAVCLAYSRKFIGVMESIGCSELVADLRLLDNDGVQETIRRIFDSRSRLHDSLRSRMPEVQAKVLALFAPENLERTGADISAVEAVEAPVFRAANEKFSRSL